MSHAQNSSRFAAAVTLVVLVATAFAIWNQGTSPTGRFASIGAGGQIGPPNTEFRISDWSKVLRNFVLLVVPMAVAGIGLFYTFSSKLSQSSQGVRIGLLLKAVVLIGLALWTLFIMDLSANPMPFGM